ncbi:MAG: NlpC/P60 family protein [Sciscionella sp.]
MTAAAGAVALAVGLVSAPAAAAPRAMAAPTSSADAVQQFQQLSSQSDKLNEQYLAAKSDLQARRAQLVQETAKLAQAHRVEQRAQAQQQRFRGRVDQLSDASYQGARFNQFSALLTGASPSDFLDRAAALQVISSENYDVLRQFNAATTQAQHAQQQASAAQQHAQDATTAANKLLTQIQQRKQALQAKIIQVRAAMNALSSAERNALASPGDQGVFLAPSGAYGIGMQAALSQRGKPYQWGGAGPDTYDCSGLIMWAFRHAGISLPHSAAAQQQMSQPVSRSDLQPGDLVFFGSPAYHDGIYVGNGEMVDAPTSGEVVKVQPIFDGFSGGGRITG